MNNNKFDQPDPIYEVVSNPTPSQVEAAKLVEEKYKKLAEERKNKNTK